MRDLWSSRTTNESDLSILICVVTVDGFNVSVVSVLGILSSELSCDGILWTVDETKALYFQCDHKC